MKVSTTKTVVFITGAFVSSACWNDWKAYFERKGYTCYAPSWPHKDALAATLRLQHPDARIAANGLASVTDFFADFVQKLPEKPILIGHSFGGLMTQLLLQRDLAAAGIAIDSGPPQFLLTTKFSFAKSIYKAFGFFTDVNKPYLMSFKDWQYAFTNGLPLEEQKASYEALLLPESKRLFREALTSVAHVDYKKPHAPLLFTAGSNDHIVPASLNYSNYKKYKDKNSVTDFKEFEGRTHFVLGQKNWQEVADYCLNWIAQH
ncbi:alpha/beta fold hydrolase [Spirosoma sp. HMF4905]|uniref:Alpha/beta fold hydrolase n=1 Tax=Spirosoma arboris TaxID=2682092 RepID=A0A7K1SI98_9BACT|nr:alpha/beta hydrolase [Spirosoma arboris]MVM33551.1 alpha/beta fold hydrolase [Spirosoma arboris]